MDSQFGFTRISPQEFGPWLATQSISRACVRVQEHHTWKPRYENFTGANHFEMQKNMRQFHMSTNGWSDIGQHFSIFPDGKIVTGRPLNTTPACIFGANSGALCIENVGNFDVGGDAMRPEHADAIFVATAALLKKIGISTPTHNNVVYHHWYNSDGSLVFHNSGQKTCPGTAFFGGNQVENFEATFLPRLRQAMGGGGGTLPVGLERWAAVTADSLNVRTAPSSGASLSNDQGPLAFGAVVRIYETAANGWVRISQTRQLWVYGRLTRDVRPATVNTADTNARMGPGMQFAVERVFQKGDRVFIVAEDGDWRQVVQDQWIHRSLLDVAGQRNAAPLAGTRRDGFASRGGSVLGVVFHDQVRFHMHRIGHVAEAGGAHEGRGHLGMVDFQVVRHVALGELHGFEHDARAAWTSSGPRPGRLP